MAELSKEYKGHRIELTPFEKYCSRFSARVFDPSGEVIKTIHAAGDTEENAYAHAERQVDFELELDRELEEKKAARRELGLD